MNEMTYATNQNKQQKQASDSPLKMRLLGAISHSTHKLLKSTPQGTRQKSSKCKGGSPATGQGHGT